MPAEDHGIPTRETCDLNDPEERFLWCFVGMSHVVGAMLAFPLEFWRKVSKHLSELGVMLRCPECGFEPQPSKKFRRKRGEPTMLGAGGGWVDVDEPDEADELAERLDKMRPEVQRRMLSHLQERFPDDETLQQMGDAE